MKNFTVLILLSCAFCGTARSAELRVGPVYVDAPGEIATLVEVHSKDIPLASDFRLLMDNQPVTAAKDVKTFHRSGKDLALVICIDVSGSIGEQRLRDIKAALFFFIGLARDRPNDRFALVSFADEINILTSFKQSREQFFDAVAQLQTSGARTRLYDALYASLDLINRHDLPKRRRIIVISGGRDEGSAKTLDNVTLKAKALKVPIDAAGCGKIDRMFLQVLGQMCDSVGGRFIEANPDVILRDRIKGLYLDLLETRSLMVYFSYEVGLADGQTDAASIEMNRSGKESLVAAIPGKYPRPKRLKDSTPEVEVPLSPSDKHELQPPIADNSSGLVRTWILPAITVILCLSIIVFISVRYAKKAGKSKASGEVEEVDDEPQGGTVTPHDTVPANGAVSLPVPPRNTLVGGYLYPPPEPDHPCAELVGVEGPLEGTRHRINSEIFTIGRAEGNHLCIPDDDYVSKQHAYLRYEKGSLFVFDNNSKSGTFVTQKRVLNTGVALEPGDRIKIGLSTIEVNTYSPERIKDQSTS